MVQSRLISVVTFVMTCVPVLAAAPVRETWDVSGVAREALVCLPAQPQADPAPLVFAFHGHGGAARQAARSFRVQEHWPEAIVVYTNPRSGRRSSHTSIPVDTDFPPRM